MEMLKEYSKSPESINAATPSESSESQSATVDNETTGREGGIDNFAGESAAPGPSATEADWRGEPTTPVEFDSGFIIAAQKRRHGAEQHASAPRFSGAAAKNRKRCRAGKILMWQRSFAHAP
jgi:hypothetical protein